jgi:hypothetical protein
MLLGLGGVLQGKALRQTVLRLNEALFAEGLYETRLKLGLIGSAASPARHQPQN